MPAKNSSTSFEKEFFSVSKKHDLKSRERAAELALLMAEERLADGAPSALAAFVDAWSRLDVLETLHQPEVERCRAAVNRLLPRVEDSDLAVGRVIQKYINVCDQLTKQDAYRAAGEIMFSLSQRMTAFGYAGSKKDDDLIEGILTKSVDCFLKARVAGQNVDDSLGLAAFELSRLMVDAKKHTNAVKLLEVLLNDSRISDRRLEGEIMVLLGEAYKQLGDNDRSGSLIAKGSEIIRNT